MIRRFLENVSQVNAHPLRGSLFENMVVADIRKWFTNQGREPRMSFFRTEKGFEVDVLVDEGGKVVPVEVKSAMTFGRNLIRNLEVFCDFVPSATTPLLLYDGDGLDGLGGHGVRARNWREGFTC